MHNNLHQDNKKGRIHYLVLLKAKKKTIQVDVKKFLHFFHKTLSINNTTYAAYATIKKAKINSKIVSLTLLN